MPLPPGQVRAGDFLLDKARGGCYDDKASKIKYARVVELADSLDSGSSVHSGRAGSSPASRTKNRQSSPKGTLSVFDYMGLERERL